MSPCYAFTGKTAHHKTINYRTVRQSTNNQRLQENNFSKKHYFPRSIDCQISQFLNAVGAGVGVAWGVGSTPPAGKGTTGISPGLILRPSWRAHSSIAWSELAYAACVFNTCCVTHSEYTCDLTESRSDFATKSSFNLTLRSAVRINSTKKMRI